jgi:hypothetical protein
LAGILIGNTDRSGTDGQRSNYMADIKEINNGRREGKRESEGTEDMKN